MKRYPKGPSAATPKLPMTTASGTVFHIVDGKRLGEIMVRGYNRHLRWVRLHVANRWGRTSPYATQRVKRLDVHKAELTTCLAPFRNIQHLRLDTLAGLLDDPDCLPAIQRDTRLLDQEMRWTAQEYYPAFNWLQAFKPGYYASSPERQEQLNALYLPIQTNQRLKDLRLLYDDGLAVLNSMAALRPAHFPFLTP
ncbi:hypothetical protein Q5H93_21540 [Hymenobacter sp. ASUV-10]|uniref:Uncharacterized protein n=1 Tax=Hymenobacter aranciens TaxID=3063996 RepID=A0ABT9BI40_9BACT|nr:hypothetical protein [Hymenobacter sp. ASUV-10]MDO7877343.1 hypothetical protein [Hymenobacter sp. ASUV-10]